MNPFWQPSVFPYLVEGKSFIRTLRDIHKAFLCAGCACGRRGSGPASGCSCGACCTSSGNSASLGSRISLNWCPVSGIRCPLCRSPSRCLPGILPGWRCCLSGLRLASVSASLVPAIRKINMLRPQFHPIYSIAVFIRIVIVLQAPAYNNPDSLSKITLYKLCPFVEGNAGNEICIRFIFLLRSSPHCQGEPCNGHLGFCCIPDVRLSGKSS